MLSEIKKEQIVQLLNSFCERAGSQAKAATQLNRVSSGTLSQMRNSNWELIADDKWRTVGAQVGWVDTDNTWNSVETSASRDLYGRLYDAKHNMMVLAITAPAGCGKTHTIKKFAAEYKNVLHISCANFFTPRYLLSEILKKLGITMTGSSVQYLIVRVVEALSAIDKPIVIFDEIDKLPDAVLNLFITLYNELEFQCAFILICTDYLEQRFRLGQHANKKGYNEMFSRFGRKFINLKANNETDVRSICLANGVTDNSRISKINAAVVREGFDLRRVRRLITVEKLKKSNPNILQ